MAAAAVDAATADTKFADYKPKVAFFFPGQGAQSVGMAKVMCVATICVQGNPNLDT